MIVIKYAIRNKMCGTTSRQPSLSLSDPAEGENPLLDRKQRLCAAPGPTRHHAVQTLTSACSSSGGHQGRFDAAIMSATGAAPPT